MASVSSLDQDMKRLRMDRYTPQAADEVRSWIETTLGEKLASGDLLDALKDGVALCKLANLVLPPPGIRYKASTMPFTQRENISQFLTACERPPLNMHSHDRFLTVDLYDSKDPAQVLQCIGAFSRAAHAVNPSKFRSSIGARQGGASSPTRKMFDGQIGRGQYETTSNSGSPAAFSRALSPALTGGSNTSNSTRTSSTPVSSWSHKTDEMTSAPAWNIHQYGYMGGASQGNQGVSFGGRRQIISPNVMGPSLAEKEKARKDREAEAERQRLEAEQYQSRARAEREDANRRAIREEDQRKEQQARSTREKERQAVEEERRRWEEEEQRWREEEEKRKKIDEDIMADTRPALNGQFLSQYQAAQTKTSPGQNPESTRILELERQLEEAKERERQYQLERQQRDSKVEKSIEPIQTPIVKSIQKPIEKPIEAPADVSEISAPESPEAVNSYRRPEVASRVSKPSKDSWAPDERSQLRRAWEESKASPSASSASTHTRPLPNPEADNSPSEAINTRPLPDPTSSREVYSAPSSSPFTRTNRFLSSNPAPSTPQPRTHFPQELGLTPESERAAEDARRIASQQKTKAGGWASKSLLEREMERERERQREWEESQAEKAKAKGILGPRELRR